MNGRVELVRNGGKYGLVEVTWHIVTSSSRDSEVFEQTEGITEFHDLSTTADIYISVSDYCTQWLVKIDKKVNNLLI